MANVIKFACTSCGKRIGVRTSAAGTRRRCALCGGIVIVPSISEPRPGGTDTNPLNETRRMDVDEGVHPDQPALWVRWKGSVRGPYSLDQLRNFREEKRLIPQMEVSRDRQAWFAAGTMADLFPSRTEDDFFSDQFHQQGGRRGSVPHHRFVTPSAPCRSQHRGGAGQRLARRKASLPAGAIIAIAIAIAGLGALGVILSRTSQEGGRGHSEADYTALVEAIDESKSILARMEPSWVDAFAELPETISWREALPDRIKLVEGELDEARSSRSEQEVVAEVAWELCEAMFINNDVPRLWGDSRVAKSPMDWVLKGGDLLRSRSVDQEAAFLKRVRDIASGLTDRELDRLFPSFRPLLNELDQDLERILRMRGYARHINEALLAAGKPLENAQKQFDKERQASDLTFVHGKTHLVEGDDHIVDNKVVRIPAEYRDIYYRTRVGPNEVFVNGRFRFVGNSEGKNAFGMTINVEVYEVDVDSAEAILSWIRTCEANEEYLFALATAWARFKTIGGSGISGFFFTQRVDEDCNEKGNEQVSAAQQALRKLLAMVGSSTGESGTRSIAGRPSENGESRPDAPAGGEFNAMLKKARELEAEGNLAGAIEAYEAALRVRYDRELSAKVDQLRKLHQAERDRLAEEAHQAQVSADYEKALEQLRSALAQQNYAEAKIGYDTALGLRPDSPELPALAQEIACLLFAPGTFLFVETELRHYEIAGTYVVDGNVTVVDRSGGAGKRTVFQFDPLERTFRATVFELTSGSDLFLGYYDPSGQGQPRFVVESELFPEMDIRMHLTDNLYKNSVGQLVRLLGTRKVALHRPADRPKWVYEVEGSPCPRGLRFRSETELAFIHSQSGVNADHLILRFLEPDGLRSNEYLKLSLAQTVTSGGSRIPIKAYWTGDVDGDNLDEVAYLAPGRVPMLLDWDAEKRKTRKVRIAPGIPDTYDVKSISVIDLRQDGTMELLVYVSSSIEHGFLCYPLAGAASISGGDGSTGEMNGTTESPDDEETALILPDLPDGWSGQQRGEQVFLVEETDAGPIERAVIDMFPISSDQEKQFEAQAIQEARGEMQSAVDQIERQSGGKVRAKVVQTEKRYGSRTVIRIEVKFTKGASRVKQKDWLYYIFSEAGWGIVCRYESQDRNARRVMESVLENLRFE